MVNRKGEKIGWIGGWLGGFIWLIILSAVWIAQGKFSNGILGIILSTFAVGLIFTLAPWKHPNTKYWKLMLPIYSLFFISVALCIYLYDDLKNVSLTWMALLWIIPCLIPFVTAGNRQWNIDS